MVRYAKKGIFPLGGIKCCILATLTMGCEVLRYELQVEPWEKKRGKR